MANSGSTKQKLPTKWLLAIVVAFIVYAFVQPIANKQFGWSLPSAASLLSKDKGQQEASIDAKDASRRDSKAGQPSRVGGSPPKSDDSPPVANSRRDSGAESGTEDGDLTYGYLRAVGKGVYQSPAGLQYVPMGGEEKHRLYHVARHMEDQPTRPVHGVFDGDMQQVLRWIDEAYSAAKSGESRAKQVESGRRDVYDVRFDKPIGYVGGQSGKRKNHPDSRNLRMVLEGNKVVTAYPSN